MACVIRYSHQHVLTGPAECVVQGNKGMLPYSGQLPDAKHEMMPPHMSKVLTSNVEKGTLPVKPTADAVSILDTMLAHAVNRLSYCGPTLQLHACDPP